MLEPIPIVGSAAPVVTASPSRFAGVGAESGARAGQSEFGAPASFSGVLAGFDGRLGKRTSTPQPSVRSLPIGRFAVATPPLRTTPSGSAPATTPTPASQREDGQPNIPRRAVALQGAIPSATRLADSRPSQAPPQLSTAASISQPDPAGLVALAHGLAPALPSALALAAAPLVPTSSGSVPLPEEIGGNGLSRAFLGANAGQLKLSGPAGFTATGQKVTLGALGSGQPTENGIPNPFGLGAADTNGANNSSRAPVAPSVAAANSLGSEAKLHSAIGSAAAAGIHASTFIDPFAGLPNHSTTSANTPLIASSGGLAGNDTGGANNGDANHHNGRSSEHSLTGTARIPNSASGSTPTSPLHSLSVSLSPSPSTSASASGSSLPPAGGGTASTVTGLATSSTLGANFADFITKGDSTNASSLDFATSRASHGELAALKTPTEPLVSSAQITHRAGGSEMRLELHTESFGSVAVHTVVRGSQVGLAITSERGNLQHALSNELPAIEHSLRENSLRLDEIRFNNPASGNGNSSSNPDGGSQQFVPLAPTAATSVGGGGPSELDPNGAAFASTNIAGPIHRLSIHA